LNANPRCSGRQQSIRLMRRNLCSRGSAGVGGQKDQFTFGPRKHSALRCAWSAALSWLSRVCCSFPHFGQGGCPMCVETFLEFILGIMICVSTNSARLSSSLCQCDLHERLCGRNVVARSLGDRTDAPELGPPLRQTGQTAPSGLFLAVTLQSLCLSCVCTLVTVPGSSRFFFFCSPNAMFE